MQRVHWHSPAFASCCTLPTTASEADADSREKHVRRVSLMIRRITQDEHGQDLVEYALLAAFIAVAAGSDCHRLPTVLASSSAR